MPIKKKVKKKKLLKAAEARALVEELSKKCADLGLALHTSGQTLKSMTGARDNCKMMYEHEVRERQARDEHIVELKKALQICHDSRSAMNSRNALLLEKVNAYEQESAGEILKRGFKLLFNNAVTRVKRLFGK